jgi:hypothetical protein
VIDPLTPELLMYEPGPNGQLELVGVDYVIKYSTLPANTLPKPTLLGVDMMNNDPLSVWALHIWSRRPNSNGMFAAWNPDVSCANAGNSPSCRSCLIDRCTHRAGCVSAHCMRTRPIVHALVATLE